MEAQKPFPSAWRRVISRRRIARNPGLLALLYLAPLVIGSASASLPGGAEASIPPGARPTVAIQPLGPVDPELIRGVAESVGQTYAVNIEVLPAIPLPPSAFYRPRRRYRGERILTSLERGAPPRASKVLGIMASD